MKNRFAALVGVLLTVLGACHARWEIAKMKDGGTAGSNAGGSGGLDGLAGAGGAAGAGGLGGMTGMENAPSNLLDPLRDSVAYYIVVDRFANGDPSNDGIPVPGVMTAANWQGGDWQGIIDKIKTGYFSKLGVNSLWLGTPVDNPDVAGVGSDGNNYSAYHGYWPVRFDRAEEHFGSLDKLKELVSEAHNAGMTVILEYQARQVHELADEYAQNPSWFTQNGMYTYLYEFDYALAAPRAYSIDKMLWWWQQTGIDGFRVDWVKHMPVSWLTDLRTRVNSDIDKVTGKHFYMVGETYTGDKFLIKSYVDPMTRLDGQLDFLLRAQICSTLLQRQNTMKELDSFLNDNDAYYGNGAMATFIGHQHLPRVIHLAQNLPLWTNPWDGGKDTSWPNNPGPKLPGEQSAFERLANAYTLLMTTQGVPLIYYGDEIGLPGAGDPDNRRFMQWTGYDANQILLRTHIEKLGQIRKEHIALRRGKRESLEATTDAMSYAMVHSNETVYVAINRGDNSTPSKGLPSETLTDLLTGQNVVGPEILLPPRSSVILIKAN